VSPAKGTPRDLASQMRDSIDIDSSATVSGDMFIPRIPELVDLRDLTLMVFGRERLAFVVLLLGAFDRCLVCLLLARDFLSPPVDIGKVYTLLYNLYSVYNLDYIIYLIISKSYTIPYLSLKHILHSIQSG